MRPFQHPSRSGTILIIVASISALLATLALTFLVRMRADIAESRLFLAETQARVMLAGALNYIGETARIGWDDPLTPAHEEAYGWIDVRDGRPGPRDFTGKALFNADLDVRLGKGTKWPAIGSWTVCDARLWTLPPTATTAHVAPNPIPPEPAVPWRELINFPNQDPRPATSDYDQFVKGLQTQLPGTDNPCWFRIYRRRPAVFIISCGAGSTGGFRTWQEVVDAGKESYWGTQEFWAIQFQNEPVFWYEVEWNAAVNTASAGYIYSGDQSLVPTNISKTFGNGTDHPNKRNQMGTFLYLQRLEKEPDAW